MTDEHELGLFTRRLWSWRDDSGGEAEWARLLDRGVLADPGHRAEHRLTRSHPAFVAALYELCCWDRALSCDRIQSLWQTISRSHSGGTAVIRRLFSGVSRAVVLGLVPGLLISGAAGAHPAFADTTPLIFLQNENGQCANEVTNGPQMEVCDFRSTEVWKKVSIPNMPNDFLIRSNVNGNCLDIVNHQGASGAQVDQRQCHFDGSDRFQDWRQEPGVDPGFVQLANLGNGSDLVMHPSGCSSADGILLFMNERSQCKADDWQPF